MDKNARIFVAGHRGLVGSAIVRVLTAEGYRNLLLRTSNELDLRDQVSVEAFFRAERPEYVVLAAARVGGIIANSTFKADFIEDNLAIQLSVIRAARLAQVQRLLFLGSSCIYPKLAPQPLKEEYLLSGPLEPTNDAYAVAKIAGIIQCRCSNQQHCTRFLAAMPTNLYGPNDNFDLQNSHVLPALIRKFHEAKVAGTASVTVWGTGTPLREFLHVDDLAEACLFLLTLDEDRYAELLTDPLTPALINVGSGEEISIADLARLVKDLVGYQGELSFDTSKPDGTPRKIMDVSRMARLGWQHRISLAAGVRSVYQWYLEHRADRAD
jgi:GDP-L-fucose synthase